MRIFKYPVLMRDHFDVRMPAGAEILSIQMQHGEPQIWALVDETAPIVERRFSIRGTGHNADGLKASDFVGTIQLDGGSLVFHLFERRP